MKRFPHLLTLLVVFSLLVACAGAPSAPADVAAPAADTGSTDANTAASADSDALEAPMLAEMVAAGSLPPLEERLPKTPMVIEPVESLGKYGGIWRTALVGGQDNAWLTRTISYDHLMRWTRDWTGVEPNVAQEVIPNEDASEYTFVLREGMKWSDGEPFTADDLVFWWEDVAMNEELSPGGPPSFMRVGDAPATVEKVDDYTVIFKFPVPNGLLLQNLSTPGGVEPTRYPKHYCSQFHSSYQDDLSEAIAAADADDWVNLFRLKCAGVPGTPYDAQWQNGELPTLRAWTLTTPYGAGTQVVAERNPYYWKVDPAGHQLPYIDKVVYEVLEDREVLLLKVLNGEIDMMSRHFNTNDNKSVIADNADAAELHFFETRSSGNTLGFMFNLNHKDPRMRGIFQDKNFRIAMSLAMNRQEAIDVILVGQGVPMNNAMDPKAIPELYDEELATMFTEFDPDLAREYLAKAGITEKGADGFYLGPDGEPFSFVVQTTDAFGHSDIAEMVVNQWRDFGVNAIFNSMDRALLYTRKDTNEHDVHVWGAGGGSEVFLDPRHFLPVTSESAYAMAWYTWYVNPTGDGSLVPPEEPPAEVKHQMDLYSQIKATGDYAQQLELMKEILAVAKDQFYVIGFSSSPPGYGIVKNNFHNVPVSLPGSWQYPDPAPTNPEQYWIE